MRSNTDSVLVVCAFMLTAFLAWHFGWVNDDAHNYLNIATHIAQWEGIAIRPNWGDNYWAVFPFGYPVIIAFFSKIVGTSFAASKLVNFFLIAASVFIAARWLRIPLLAVAALFSTAWMLEIVSYSWSENSYIFAHILALASLSWFVQTGHGKWLLCYGAGLFLAISSRYIGGFMLGGYMAIVALLYWRGQRERLLAPLLVTLLCGALFGAYLITNKILTGYPTGMERMPVRETFSFLALQFIEYLFYSLWMIIPALLMLFSSPNRGEVGRGAQSGRSLSGTRPHPNPPPNGEGIMRALPPLILGAWYLIVLFTLRNMSHFEQFSGRMLSPGMLLIWLGVLHMFSNHAQTGMRMRLIFIAAFVINMGALYKDIATWPNIPFTESAKKAQALYQEKYKALSDGTLVISIGPSNPSVGWNYVSPIFGADRIFYMLLDNPSQTLPELRAHVARLRYKEKLPAQYLFDFTEFSDQESFDKALAARNLNPEVAAWIKSYFSARSWVECTACNPTTK